jgi:6-phosphogluconolactonase
MGVVGRTICICADPDELAERSAEYIAARARETVATRGTFTLCLSGGETPVPTYRLLGDRLGVSVPWDRVHVFWGDERCIPLDRPDSHFTMATELMLSRLPIPTENIHRAHGEADDPSRAAREYEDALRGFFGGPVPSFDLVLLGMGEDGHVASIFPGSPGWAERRRWVVDHYVVKRGERVRRLTLTMPVLTAAREIAVLVSGEHKADALAAVIDGDADLPAGELNREAARISWFVDRDAASRLEHGRAVAL